ncbi:RHS repeat-associated core domain-containing protein [Aliikangiella sp. G2MR2-5]|uniref:RHS repeat-associated core domain-containing protein n=1 Tax=Aliikangiella sp. G2MR2-5 TaxID=2788943 RepID=UPI0018AB4FE6|nr:RHS repeat-associated core domain-containing protein [Aliikangiella sp. G2MR2-5]
MKLKTPIYKVVIPLFGLSAITTLSQANIPGELTNGAGGSVSADQHLAKSNQQVGNSGAVNYSFPLGQHVSASYSSNGGWSVGQVSHISRSTRFGLPKYNENDIFTLNGQELVCATNCEAVSGDRIYHLSNENYQKIEFINIDSEDSYWQVTDKNGGVTRYGASDDSRIEAVDIEAAHPRVWAITDKKDAANTELTKYLYSEIPEAGNYYLHFVISGKVNAAINGYSCAELEYEWLPANNRKVSYQDGSYVEEQFHVINVYNKIGCELSGSGGMQTSRNQLLWESAPFGELQRISAIRSYGSGDVAKPDTLFEYYELAPGFGEAENWGNPEGDFGFTDAIQEYSNSRTKAELLDMNGDALPDRVRKDEEENFRIWLNNGDGFANNALNWGNPASDAIREGDDTKADLIDMDADGKLDRVRKNNNEDMVVRRNKGNGFSEPDGCTWGNPEGRYSANLDIRVSVNGINTHESDPWGTIIDLVDMNGDGYPDRVYKGSPDNDGEHNYDNYHFKVWLNDGCGFDRNLVQDWGSPEDSLFGEPGNIRHMGSKTITQLELMDINGDGLPDRLLKRASEPLYVWLNTGSGFENEHLIWENSTDGHALRQTVKSGETNYTVRDLVDMNGDGLPDRVYKRQDSPSSGLADLKVYLNTGRGFSTVETNWGSPDNQFLRKVESNESSFALIDMNGDRLPDRVIKCDTSCAQTDFSVRLNLAKPGEMLLKKVTNHLGGQTSYVYQPLDLSPTGYNPDYGQKRWVVSKKIISDGFGDNGTGEEKRTTTYEFHGGVYDKNHRQDLGFEKMFQIEPTGDVRETHFYQLINLSGVVKKSLLRQGAIDGPIHEYRYDYYEDRAEDPNDYSYGIQQARPNPGPDAEVYSPKIHTVHNFIVSGSTSVDLGGMPEYSGLGFKRTKQTYEYDSFGNVKSEINYGLVDSQEHTDVGIDKVTNDTRWGYYLSKWIMKPILKESLEWNVDTQSYQLSAKTQFIYDDSESGVGENGWLTTKRIFQDESNSYDINYRYDTDGNLEREQNGRGFWTIYTFEPRYKRYQQSVELPSPVDKANITTSHYDSLMRLTSTVDGNENTTSYGYDSFGRVSYIVKPLDELAYPTIRYFYTDWEPVKNTPSYVQKQVKDEAAASIISRTYYDGFGQVIETKTEAPAYGDNGQIRYRTVDSWQFVEGNKKVRQTSIPYFTTGAEYSRNLTPDKKESRSETYLNADSSISSDYLGTVIKTTSASERPTYQRDFHFTTYNLDASFHFTSTVKQPESLKRSIYQYTGVFPANSFYARTEIHDYFHKQQIFDHHGNTTVKHKNFLGQTVREEDMDRGIWQYSYDKNGNLKTQTDAKNVLIVFDYDVLDRIQSKTYPDGSTIEYYYDGDEDRDGEIDSGRRHILGQLAKVSDFSGYTRFWYDERYRITREQKKINGLSTRNIYFRYDSMDRISGIKYPADDNYTVIGYDRGGAMLSITADGMDQVISQVNYSEQGQVKDIFFNGSSQHFEYWDESRDYRLKSNYSLKTQDTSELIRYEYDYDAVGNIEKIDGYLDSVLTPQYSRTFTYDDLSRLKTQSNVDYFGGSELFSYDEIGNITERNGVKYVYPEKGKARPHAVTSVGSKAYQYNDNGDMFDRNGDLIDYDFDRQMVQYKDESYLYDYAGRRVKKWTSEDTIYYPNKYYEIRNDKPIKFYYLNGVKIARHKRKEYSFIHNDHLQGSSIITDISGVKTRELLYNSFGEVKRNVGSGESPDYKYTGKEEDSSGLNYFGARYYDPGIGKFIQADTLYDGASGPEGLNLYAYSANNPIKFNDPSGNSAGDPIAWLKAIKDTYSGINNYNSGNARDGVLQVTGSVAFAVQAVAESATNSLAKASEKYARSAVVNSAKAVVRGRSVNPFTRLSGTGAAVKADIANSASKTMSKGSKMAGRYAKAAGRVGVGLTVISLAPDAYNAASSYYNGSTTKGNYYAAKVGMGGAMAAAETTPLGLGVSMMISVSEAGAQNFLAQHTGETTAGFIDTMAMGTAILSVDGGGQMIVDALQESNTGYQPIDSARHALGNGIEAVPGIMNNASIIADHVGDSVSSAWNNFWSSDEQGNN